MNASTATTSSAAPGSGRLPLAGIRVLDLTMVWAGPFATKQLSDAGAEVIKVEGPGRVDLVRSLTLGDPDSPRHYDTSRYFNEYNRNKLGMAIDLQRPEGKQIAQRIAAVSDVVIENFRPGVLERLGLGYDVLAKLNPAIIVVSIPGYSSVPPERGLPGYGPNIEQMSGLAYLNGYPGGPPQKSGISYGDPVAGLAGAAAVLLALVHRSRTGRGQRIEVSQRNVLTGLIGDAVIGHQLGLAYDRIGNRSRDIAPQGVYPCALSPRAADGAVDSFVAISVTNDAAFTALTRAMGEPDLADDPRYAGVADRLNHQDELDRRISAWTAPREAEVVARTLQSVGVAASPVLLPADVAEDEHLRARGFFTEVEHETFGRMTLTTPTLRFEDVHRELHRAPWFGEHNHHVLSELLGYSDEQIAGLEAAGVIASEPRT